MSPVASQLLKKFQNANTNASADFSDSEEVQSTAQPTAAANAANARMPLGATSMGAARPPSGGIKQESAALPPAESASSDTTYRGVLPRRGSDSNLSLYGGHNMGDDEIVMNLLLGVYALAVPDLMTRAGIPLLQPHHSEPPLEAKEGRRSSLNIPRVKRNVRRGSRSRMSVEMELEGVDSSSISEVLWSAGLATPWETAQAHE